MAGTKPYEVMDDAEMDAAFGDLEDPEAEDTSTSTEAPETTTVEATAEEEVTTETTEETESVTTDEGEAKVEEETAETETVEYEVKDDWKNLEKDALVAELAKTEDQRKKWQRSYTDLKPKEDAISQIENDANMPIEQVSSLFSGLNDPEFVAYLQAWQDGKPVKAGQAVSQVKSPQDFMPEGEEYMPSEAQDYSTASGQANLQFLDWRKQQADERAIQATQQKQAVQQEKALKTQLYAHERFADLKNDFEQWLVQFDDKAKAGMFYWDAFLAEKDKPTKGKNVAADTIAVVRKNKEKAPAGAAVSGAAVGEVDEATKDLDDTFGDYH
jgi:hypothetical protein